MLNKVPRCKDKLFFNNLQLFFEKKLFFSFHLKNYL